MNGSTTPSVAPMATAASTASPPAWRLRRPAWVASGWFDATAPRRPMMTGRYDRGPSKATILASLPECRRRTGRRHDSWPVVRGVLWHRLRHGGRQADREGGALAVDALDG